MRVQYLKLQDFDNAYRVACLGVTDHDWRELAMASLLAMRLEIARKVWQRLVFLWFDAHTIAGVHSHTRRTVH